VFISLLAFSLLRLQATQDTMRLQAPGNMLWVVTQARSASLRLSTAVARRTTGGIDPAALERRYNVFLSRLNLLQQGPQRRKIEASGFAGEFDRLRPQLRAMHNRIKTLQPTDTRSANAIGELLNQYNTLLAHAATKTMVSEWDMLGGKLDVGREQIRQIYISLVGIRSEEHT